MVGPLILLGAVALCALLYVLSELRRDWRTVNARRRASRVTGIPPASGYGAHSAFTAMRERGTRTPETGTTAVFSSYRAPGGQWVDPDFPAWRLRANSFTAPGSFGGATAEAGANGAPRKSAA